MEHIATRNLVAINPKDFGGGPGEKVQYVRVRNSVFPAGVVFSTECSDDVPQGKIGFLGAHRTWAKIAEGDTVDVAKVSCCHKVRHAISCCRASYLH